MRCHSSTTQLYIIKSSHTFIAHKMSNLIQIHPNWWWNSNKDPVFYRSQIPWKIPWRDLSRSHQMWWNAHGSHHFWLVNSEVTYFLWVSWRGSSTLDAFANKTLGASKGTSVGGEPRDLKQRVVDDELMVWYLLTHLLPSGYVKIAIEHGHRNLRNSGFTHWTWWFSIAMLNCQRGINDLLTWWL